jgi:hypothetical protein
MKHVPSNEEIAVLAEVMQARADERRAREQFDREQRPMVVGVAIMAVLIVVSVALVFYGIAFG